MILLLSLTAALAAPPVPPPNDLSDCTPSARAQPPLRAWECPDARVLTYIDPLDKKGRSLLNLPVESLAAGFRGAAVSPQDVMLGGEWRAERFVSAFPAVRTDTFVTWLRLDQPSPTYRRLLVCIERGPQAACEARLLGLLNAGVPLPSGLTLAGQPLPAHCAYAPIQEGVHRMICPSRGDLFWVAPPLGISGDARQQLQAQWANALSAPALSAAPGDPPRCATAAGEAPCTPGERRDGHLAWIAAPQAPDSPVVLVCAPRTDDFCAAYLTPPAR